jgi:hypothetical protein
MVGKLFKMPPTTLLVAIMLIEYLVSSTALAFTTRQGAKAPRGNQRGDTV